MQTQSKKDLEHPSIINLFTDLTSDVKWATIDEIRQTLDANGDFWAQALTMDSDKTVKNLIIRRLMKSIKNEEGQPIYASIQTEDKATGEVVRVYKQETLFDIEDYVQTAEFHSARVVHHAKMASYYAKGYQEVTGKQLPLPFDSTSILLD